MITLLLAILLNWSQQTTTTKVKNHKGQTVLIVKQRTDSKGNTYSKYYSTSGKRLGTSTAKNGITTYKNNKGQRILTTKDHKSPHFKTKKQ